MLEKGQKVSFEIQEYIGVIKRFPSGWAKELNLVSWNGVTARYDIREWDAAHEHMSRGLTLHPEEMRTIFGLLKDREI